MILTIPAAWPSGVMLLMYANGSANSSGVGRNTGHRGTSTLFVRRWSLTLALMARCISASLKSPELASSLEGGLRLRFARPAGAGEDVGSTISARGGVTKKFYAAKTKHNAVSVRLARRATSPPACRRGGPWGFRAR
jgi:hypothetical protein